MSHWAGGAPQGEYMRFARAYMTNEIIFASIDLLSDSAGEPQIVGRRYRRESPRILNRLEVRSMLKDLTARGLSHREANDRMIRNGFYEAIPNHPLVKLLNKPNPIASRGQLWGTVVMDRYIAGNAYLLKSRFQNGPLKGAVGELWRMRPDRVKVIPGAGGIEGYEYNTGRDKIVYPAADVLHFKERHPLNDYYGLSPIQVVYERLMIEDNMRGFLRTFFETGGVGPKAVLSVKQKLNQTAKEGISDYYDKAFGGPNPRSLMVIDQNEHAYTKLGLERGLRDALPQEIDAASEARIAMVFRIPASILGTRVGMESSSYANKRQDWQVFWDLTMTPLLSDMDDTLCLGLIGEGGFGAIDEVCFDLGDIRALQEDTDKLHERHRKNVAAGLESWEEGREAIGFDPDISEGTFLIPGNVVPISVKRMDSTADEGPPEPTPPQITAPANIIAEVHCPKCGRWVGRNMNVGAVAYCPKDKEVLVGDESEERMISIEVIRDEEGRATKLIGAAQ